MTPLQVVLYMHGGGWMAGNAFTHDRLVRELVVGTSAALVFVEYTRSPEARYPVAIEQGYAAAQWVTRKGAAHGLDPDRLAVAGDAAGGNMTAALTLVAKQRGDVRFVHQSLYYPTPGCRHASRRTRHRRAVTDWHRYFGRSGVYSGHREISRRLRGRRCRG